MLSSLLPSLSQWTGWRRGTDWRVSCCSMQAAPSSPFLFSLSLPSLPSFFPTDTILRHIFFGIQYRVPFVSTPLHLSLHFPLPNSHRSNIPGSFHLVALQAEGDWLPPGHTVSQLETYKIRSIRAGTLERLVETLLTAFGDNDLTYTNIFLSTYRAFASTHTVLQLLLDKYVWYWAGGPWWLECIAGADNSWSWWDLVSAGFCPSHSAITPGSIINMILMKSHVSVELGQSVYRLWLS